MDQPPPVARTVDEWIHQRRSLRTDQSAIGRVMAYYGATLEHGPLLVPREWELAGPVPTNNLELRLAGTIESPRRPVPTPAVGVLPPGSSRGERYSSAVQRLASPGIFADRVCYQACDISVGDHGICLTLGVMRYFEFFDEGEAMRHEWELVGDDVQHAILRRALGDLTNLGGRKVIIGVTVVTLRVDHDNESATFLVHRRDPTAVATEQGQWHVVPCGVFQPRRDDATTWGDDANLSDLVIREFAEELLGMDEDVADDEIVNRFRDALASGGLRIWITGIGINPVIGNLEILCAAVFSDSTFDEVLRDLVTDSPEGSLRSPSDSVGVAGFAFERGVIDTLLSEKPFAPSGEAALRAAWRWRQRLMEQGADPAP